jgi:hypothetical protein
MDLLSFLMGMWIGALLCFFFTDVLEQWTK